MKRSFICIALTFSFLINAQVNKDSLWDIWQDKSKADTIRSQALYNFAWDGYLFSQPDSAFYFAQINYNFSKERGLKKREAGALIIQGVSLAIRGENINALDYFQRVYDINEELGHPKGMANMLNNMGNTYVALGENLKAIDCYKRSLKIKESTGYLKSLPITLLNIGGLYSDIGDNKNALDYYKKGLRLAKEVNSENGIGDALCYLGEIYMKLGDFESAMRYHQLSLEKNETIDSKLIVAQTLNNMGSTYFQKKEFDLAESYFSRSLSAYKAIESQVGISSSSIHLGQTYFELGNFNKAQQYCNDGYTIALDTDFLMYQELGCQCLHKVYKARGNSRKALYFLEKMIATKDSLKEVDTAKKIQRFEFDKEKLKDSLQNEEAKLKTAMAHQIEVRKKDKNKNIALGTGLFFILVSGGLYSRWRYTKKAKAVIEKEKDRSENLLLNILPAEIAEELKEKGSAEAKDFEMVSILFSDFKGFTGLSEKMSAKDLVANINQCFEAFDNTMQTYNIEKIKTIGDAYMAAGGLPVNSETSVKDTVLAALDMQDFILKLNKEKETKGEHAFEMRVGIHTGPVVAGIVGVKKFQYDIWGDTVNTASRIESHGEVGKVNISKDTYNYIKEEPEFTFVSRGKIQAKGKGEVEMYFVGLK